MKISFSIVRDFGANNLLEKLANELERVEVEEFTSVEEFIATVSKLAEELGLEITKVDRYYTARVKEGIVRLDGLAQELKFETTAGRFRVLVEIV